MNMKEPSDERMKGGKEKGKGLKKYFVGTMNVERRKKSQEESLKG